MNKGRIVKFLCGFMCICLSFCLFSFDSLTSYAAAVDSSRIFFINQDRPPVTDTQGYIEALCVDGYGEDYVITFFWHINGTPSDSNVEAQFFLNNVDVKPHGNEVSFYGISSNAHSRPTIIQLDGGDGVNFYLDIPQCKGFRFYGALDVSYIAPGLEVFNGEFITVYNNERSLYDSFIEIIALLESQEGWTEEQINQLLASHSSMQGVLSSILDYVQQEFSIIEQMWFMFNSWDLYFMKLNELEPISYYVWEIWDRLTTYISDITAFPSDAEGLENFENDNKVQQDKLDEYAQESVVPKPDELVVEDVVNSNVNFEAVSEFGASFSSITSVPYVLEMLLVVFTLALISYVLYGKRA